MRLELCKKKNIYKRTQVQIYTTLLVMCIWEEAGRESGSLVHVELLWQSGQKQRSFSDQK